jgi:ParB family transcriptional regulator, chromosome partitioning protein
MTERETKVLGRGIGALLGTVPTVSRSRGGGTLPLALMQAGGFQPRREIHREPLEELAASIKTSGLIQPIVVRPLQGSVPGGAQYEIVAGERRWQAAKLAGLTDIPAIVRELSDQEAVAVALIENIQREELTAAEEARALKRLHVEFFLTHQELADTVGRSRAAVTNLIRLLDLPDSVVQLIDSKAISMGHARALLGLERETERARLAQVVVSGALSVRETEKLVRKALEGKGGDAPAKKHAEQTVVSEVMRTERVRVQLHQKSAGSGKIIIEFADPEARDQLLNLISSLHE